MEKITYDITFNLKNNPSGVLREINKLMIDVQGSMQKMTNLASQQISIMQSPIDEAREKWLNLTGDAGAYFAIISENTAGVASFIEIRKYLDDIGATTKITSMAQDAYNKIVGVGGSVISVYQMQIRAARAAISTTTGATKALNMVIAASPWMLAAAGIAAVATVIYKLCTNSDEAAKAQERLNNSYKSVQQEVSTETTKLNLLFDELNKAQEGTDAWKQAKDRIVSQYGDYLKQLGIEITDVTSAKVAYDKLSASIRETARSRASEKALSEAGDKYASTESEQLTKMRDSLIKNMGEKTGGDIFEAAAASIRKGENISKDWRKFILGISTNIHSSQIEYVKELLKPYVKEIENANQAYEKELKRVKDVLGTPVASQTNAGEITGNAVVTGDNSTPPPPPVVTPHIELKPAEGSLAALEAKLSELKEKQQKAPLEEIVTFSVDIAQLQSDIASAQSIINKTNFQAAHPVKPTDLNATPVGGRYITTGSLDIDPKDHKLGLKDVKLEPMNFDIQDPLTSMEKWNEAVGLAREKNQELTDNMGAVGNAMGSVGNLIGGAAGEWLQWGANAVQAIGQAIPQVLALLGVQSTQATANTVVAGTGAAASVSSIPIVGPILAIAAVASVLGALANLPKFAYGGIAYGPTLGLFGEYTGAMNNPEVVAPLNRLRQLIQPVGNANVGGTVEFKIAGRYLKGILNREGNLNNRS